MVHVCKYYWLNLYDGQWGQSTDVCLRWFLCCLDFVDGRWMVGHWDMSSCGFARDRPPTARRPTPDADRPADRLQTVWRPTTESFVKSFALCATLFPNCVDLTSFSCQCLDQL